MTSWNADRYRTDKNPMERLSELVESSYTMLGVLGVHPIIGQDFTETDARAKRHKLMLGYHVWKQLRGRPEVIGQQLWSWTPDTTGEIVGVLPPTSSSRRSPCRT